MADNADHATELMEQTLEHALATRATWAGVDWARAECEKCGEEIPATKPLPGQQPASRANPSGSNGGGMYGETVKGGPLASLAAMLCRDARLRLYLDRRRRHKIGSATIAGLRAGPSWITITVPRRFSTVSVNVLVAGCIDCQQGCLHEGHKLRGTEGPLRD